MINTCGSQLNAKKVTFSQDTPMNSDTAEESKQPQGGQQTHPTQQQIPDPLQQAALDQPKEFTPEQLCDKQACWAQLDSLFEQRVRQFARL